MSQVYNEIVNQLLKKIISFHSTLQEELTFLQHQLPTKLLRQQCIDRLYNSLMAVEQRLAYAENQMAQEVYYKRRLLYVGNQAAGAYLEWQRMIQEQAWGHQERGIKSNQQRQQVAVCLNRVRWLEQQEAKKLAEQLKIFRNIIKRQLAKQLGMSKICYFICLTLEKLPPFPQIIAQKAQ